MAEIWLQTLDSPRSKRSIEYFVGIIENYISAIGGSYQYRLYGEIRMADVYGRVDIKTLEWAFVRIFRPPKKIKKNKSLLIPRDIIGSFKWYETLVVDAFFYYDSESEYTISGNRPWLDNVHWNVYED